MVLGVDVYGISMHIVQVIETFASGRCAYWSGRRPQTFRSFRFSKGWAALGWDDTSCEMDGLSMFKMEHPMLSSGYEGAKELGVFRYALYIP